VIDFSKEGMKQSGPNNPKYPFDTARLRNVVELAAQKSGWANKKAAPYFAKKERAQFVRDRILAELNASESGRSNLNWSWIVMLSARAAVHGTSSAGIVARQSGWSPIARCTRPSRRAWLRPSIGAAARPLWTWWPTG